MAVLDLASVDFCVEYVACLDLAQQEALDAPSNPLVTYVLLYCEAVLGGNHALIELLTGTVVAAKEREHSVKLEPHFVNLVRLVHGLHQVQEALEGDEEVHDFFHDFPETGSARDKVVASPLDC